MFGPRKQPGNGSHNRRDRRRGMVLIIVMIVIVMLSLAGFSFAALMFTERKAVGLHGDELQLASGVESGVEYLKAYLGQPLELREEAGGSIDNPDAFRGIALTGEEEAPRQPRFSVVSANVENGELAGVRFGVVDESARLNLAVLPVWEQQVPGSGKRALMSIPEMTEEAAESILDWVDGDSESRSLGAEDDYYSGLEPAYAPRNAAPESLEELLLVKGVTRSQLFGHDDDRNFHVDEYEAQAAESDMQSASFGSTQPWASYLTVYSAEKNVSANGRTRVNLNDSNLVQLQQSLAGVLDRRWSQFILAYRQFGPYTGSDADDSNAAFTLNLNLPANSRIASIFDLIGAKVQIPAATDDATAVVIASPFREDRESMRGYLPKLLDLTTLTESPVTRGRINVNRASRAVLLGVPGLDEATAEQIVAARDAQFGQQRPETRFASWLLIDGLVDLAKMKELSPYLTAGGGVFRAQVVGFFDERAPTARAEVIIDTTTTPARQLYRQDLRMLGRGFSADTLGAEPTESTRDVDNWPSTE